MEAHSDDGPADRTEHFLALAEGLRRAERQAASFRVASAIGHLIGTPLNVIAGRAALVRGGADSDRSEEHARKIEEQVERLASEVRRLIEHLSPPRVTPEPAPLARVVDDALVMCTPAATSRGVALEVVGEVAGTLADGRSGLLVLTSLVSLASTRSPPGSTVRIALDEGPGRPGVASFRLTAPSSIRPPGRIDRIEPPREATAGDVEVLHVLSTNLSIAQRFGGTVRVDAGEADTVAIVFECPRID